MSKTKEQQKRQRTLTDASQTSGGVYAAYDAVGRSRIPVSKSEEFNDALMEWVEAALREEGENSRTLAAELSEVQQDYDAAGIQFALEHPDPAGPLLIDPNRIVTLPEGLCDEALDAVPEKVVVESRQHDAQRAKVALREAIKSFIRNCRNRQSNPCGDWYLDALEGGPRVLVWHLPRLCYREQVTRRGVPHNPIRDEPVRVRPDAHAKELIDANLPGRDALSVVEALTAKLLPRPTEDDSKALLHVIANANQLIREEEPRESFVEAVNHLLAATGHSIEITVGRTRHRVLELIVKNGSIQFRPAEGGGFGLNHPAKLIRGR